MKTMKLTSKILMLDIQQTELDTLTLLSFAFKIGRNARISISNAFVALSTLLMISPNHLAGCYTHVMLDVSWVTTASIF